MSESYLDHLNEAQRQAVVQTEGPVMIIAGAVNGRPSPNGAVSSVFRHARPVPARQADAGNRIEWRAQEELNPQPSDP